MPLVEHLPEVGVSVIHGARVTATIRGDCLLRKDQISLSLLKLKLGLPPRLLVAPVDTLEESTTLRTVSLKGM